MVPKALLCWSCALRQGNDFILWQAARDCDVKSIEQPLEELVRGNRTLSREMIWSSPPPEHVKQQYKSIQPAPETVSSGLECRTISIWEQVRDPPQFLVVVWDPWEHQCKAIPFAKAIDESYATCAAWPEFEVPQYWIMDPQPETVDSSGKRYTLALTAKPISRFPLPYETIHDFVVRMTVVQGSLDMESRDVYNGWQNANPTIFRPTHYDTLSLEATVREALIPDPRSRAAKARQADSQLVRHDSLIPEQ